MANNFLIPFEKKKNNFTGNSTDISFNHYHHYYLKTMNLTSNSLRTPRRTNTKMNQTACLSLYGLEDHKSINSKHSLKASTRLSEDPPSSDLAFNPIYNQTVSSRKTKSFNQSKVLHSKSPTNKHILTKRPTKDKVSNYYLAFNNGFDHRIPYLAEGKTKMAEDYEKLMESNQKRTGLTSQCLFFSSLPHLFEYPDEIEAYKEYLRMIDSTELLKAKTKQLMLSIQDSTEPIRLLGPTLKVKNIYFETAMSKVVRAIQMLSRNNQLINEDEVMNMLGAECESIKAQIDLEMNAYCNIKNFSYAVMNDKGVVLLPFINSMRMMTEREKEKLILRKLRLHNSAGASQLQLKGDFQLKKQLGSIEEQSNAKQGYNRHEPQNKSQVDSIEKDNNDMPIAKKATFMEMYNSKYNSKKVNLNPSTISNEQAKWSKSNEMNSYRDNSSQNGYSNSIDPYNGNSSSARREEDNDKSNKKSSFKVSTPLYTSVNRKHNNTEYYNSTEKQSTRRSDSNHLRDRGINSYENKETKQSAYRDVLHSITNHSERDKDDTSPRKHVKDKGEVGYDNSNPTADGALKNKLSQDKRLSKFMTIIPKDRVMNSNYNTNDSTNNPNYATINRNAEEMLFYQQSINHSELNGITHTEEGIQMTANVNCQEGNNLEMRREDQKGEEKERVQPKKKKGKKGNVGKRLSLIEKKKDKGKNDKANDQEPNGSSIINDNSEGINESAVNTKTEINGKKPRFNIKGDNPSNDSGSKQNSSEQSKAKAIIKKTKEIRPLVKKSTRAALSYAITKGEDGIPRESILDNPAMRKRIEEIQYKRKKTMALFIDSLSKSSLSNSFSLATLKDLGSMSDQELHFIFQDKEFQDKIKQLRASLPPNDPLSFLSDAELLRNYLNTKQMTASSNNTAEEKATGGKFKAKSRQDYQEGNPKQFTSNTFDLIKEAKAINAENEGRALFTVGKQDDRSYKQKRDPANKKTIERLFNEAMQLNEEDNELRALNKNFNILSLEHNGFSMQSKLREMSLEKEIEYQMSLQDSEEGKLRFQELFSQIEQLKQEDTGSYINSLNMYYQPFREEIAGLIQAKKMEDRLNNFLGAFENFRQKQIGKRNLLNRQIIVKDYKFISTISDFHTEGSHLKKK